MGRTRVDEGTKLKRLLANCNGKAETCDETCSLIRPELGYTKARQLLNDRFGNDYKISEAWAKRVTEGGPNKAKYC